MEINEMFVFDVDGVLTLSQTSGVRKSEIFEFLVKILERNEPIAFVTGRYQKWARDNLLSPLTSKLPNPSFAQNIFATCEKGGIIITYDGEGKEKVKVNEDSMVPSDIRDALRNLAKNKFSEYVFYDENKENMVTLEKRYEISLEEFESIHSDLNAEIKKILDAFDLKGKFIHVPTTFDTDIESKIVGKGYSVREILKWLKNKNISVNSFITFGDSSADLEVLDELKKQGKKVKFIYVGKKPLERKDQEIIVTEAKFDEGTLEYLQSH